MLYFRQKKHEKHRASYTTKGYTGCFTNLEKCSEMIIYESILTTYIFSVIFRGAGTVLKIDFSLKSNHCKQSWLT